MPRSRRWPMIAGAVTAVVAIAAPGGQPAAAAGAAISHLRAAPLASTSMALTWRNSGGQQAVTIRYNSGPRAPKTPHGGRPGGRIAAPAHAHTVTQLRPATHYSFALFPYYGDGAYGPRVVVHATTGPGPVRLLQPFATKSFVQLTWRAPTPKRYAGTVVRVAKGGRAPASPSAGRPVHLTGPRSLSARLSGLAPHTTYSAAVWTRDRHHHYSLSTVTRFTTLGQAPRPTGTIRGLITDDAHHPLAGVHVYVGNAVSQNAQATTASDGRYALTVEAGTYQVMVDGTDATGGNADSTGYRVDFTTTSVGANGTRTLNDALLPGALIKGRVVDVVGHGIQGVQVLAQPPTAYAGQGFGFFFFASFSELPVTDSTGHFALRGLPQSALQICYQTQTGAAAGYLGRCEHRAVSVAGGATRTMASVTLVRSPAGRVSGTVMDSHGRPAADAIVEVLGRTGDGAGDTFTDALGHYEVGGLSAGSYDVCVDPESMTVASDSTGDALTCRFGAAQVALGRTRTVNLRLHAGGAAAGRLTGPGGHPVIGAQVLVRRAGTYTGGAEITDSTGRFEVKNLPPGRYQACFDATFATVPGVPTGVRRGCYGGGDVFEVRARKVRLAIDTRLGAAGAIAGTVRKSTSGHPPAAGIYVVVEHGTADEGEGFGTRTDSHGRYSFSGLSSGRYKICTTPDPMTREACVGTVQVTAGRTVHRDLTFTVGASVTVTVRDSGGHPVSGVNAVVVTRCTDALDCESLPLFSSGEPGIAGSDMTDETGSITFAGLEPSKGAATYAVCAFAYYGATTAGEPTTGYRDKCTSHGTFTLKVGAGQHKTVTLTLQSASGITGRVTDASGHPLAGVHVEVANSSTTDYQEVLDMPFPVGNAGPAADVATDADGTFTVPGVLPGHQRVCFETSSAVRSSGAASTGGYLDQCLGGAPGGSNDGTPVTVPSSGTVDVGTFHVAGGSEIDGQVVDGRTGAAVAGGEVIAFDSSQQPYDGEEIGRGGGFRISRLPAGAYRLCFWAQGYRLQCYHGVPWSGDAVPSNAEVVTTTAGQAVHLRVTRLKPA